LLVYVALGQPNAAASSETVESEVVSIADIEGAERLVGVAYTAAEREQMVGNLEGQIASAIARRNLRFDNSMPTASRFDPRLPNFRMPGPGSPRVFLSPRPDHCRTMRPISLSRRFRSWRAGSGRAG
jgi:hypothetical protein